jgi:soluble lytic murein transglycosylase-like protein
MNVLPLVALAVVTAGGSSAPGPVLHWADLLREGLVRQRTSDFDGAVTSLQASAGRAPGDHSTRAKIAIVLARTESDRGRPQDALEILRVVDRGKSPAHLREYMAFEWVRALTDARDPGSRKALGEFLRDHPRSRLADDVRLRLGKLALEAGDTGEASRLAEGILGSKAGRILRAEALRLKARSSPEPMRSQGLRRLFIELPDTEAAAASGFRESDLTPGELDERSEAFHRAMDYEEALRIQTARWESGEQSPARALKLARLHLIHLRDDGRKALSYLETARAGGLLREPDGHLLFARAQAKVEDYDAAAASYRAYLATGASDYRARALYYLGWLPYDHGRYEEALPHLDRFLSEVKKDRMRSYIFWAKAWSLYQLGRYDEALKVFEAMLPMGNSLVAGKAMYWGGMSHKAMGRAEEAGRWMGMVLDRYPLTWYAVLASKRMAEWKGEPLPDWITGPAPGLPDPEPYWPFDRLKGANLDRLRRVKDLSEIGEIEAARAIYRPIAASVERSLPPKARARFMLTVYDAIEDYHELYKRARKEFGRHMGRVPTPESAIYWMVLYPRAQRALAHETAGRFDLPEHWIYSIMRQESRYDSRQVSHTAALGIMQMIPATAKIVSRVLEVPFHVETFFKPGQNVLFCTWYLAALLRDFKEQIVFASAAYNAGAPPIKRFMEKHRGSPFDAMVEFIAYNEARNYCRKVAEHLTRYAYLHLPPDQRAGLYRRLFPDEVEYEIGTAIDY